MIMNPGETETPDTPEDEAAKISALKEKIDNEDYLYEAIQRIALVMSNEITGETAAASRSRRDPAAQQEQK